MHSLIRCSCASCMIRHDLKYSRGVLPSMWYFISPGTPLRLLNCMCVRTRFAIFIATFSLIPSISNTKSTIVHESSCLIHFLALSITSGFRKRNFKTSTMLRNSGVSLPSSLLIRMVSTRVSTPCSTAIVKFRGPLAILDVSCEYLVPFWSKS